MNQRDLGVQSIVEVRNALNKIKGPPVVHNRLQPDDFSNLKAEERIAVSIAGRKRANDIYLIPKEIISFIAKVYLFRLLMEKILKNFLTEKIAKRLVWIAILIILWNRCAARRIDNKLKAVKMYPFFGAMIALASRKGETHDHLLEFLQSNQFKTLIIPVPGSAFVLLMDARDREYVLKTNSRNYLKNREGDAGSFE